MAKKNISVICAIVKNEQRYIREWADHYLSIGFDKLYVFEDFGSQTHSSELRELIDSGKVVLTSLSESNVLPHYRKGTHVQRGLYNYFLDRCKKEYIADWCGFFDVDEFMMFEDGWDLQKLEEVFSGYGGVLLSWRNFGANGHVKRPEGKIVDNYTTHLPDGTKLGGKRDSTEWNVKSLVNVHKATAQRSIHVFNGCRFTDGREFGKGGMVYCKAWLNHYYSKSWEDYCDRMFARGNMHNNYRCFDLFFKVSPEFMPRKKELIESVRYRHTVSTMWISRQMKVISGGNVNRLNELNRQLVYDR